MNEPSPAEYRTGMALAAVVDLWWDALVGLRGPTEERLAIHAIMRCIDAYRDAQSETERLSAHAEWDVNEK